MNAIYFLWLREVKRFLRSRWRVIISLVQPIIYLLAVGFGLGPVFEKAGAGSYLQFMTPGIIGVTVLFSSISSGAAILWDRQFGFLKETLVAPTPRLYVMIGRTLGGATAAIIQGILVISVCLIVGFRPQHWSDLFLAFPFVAMIAIVFGALGTVIGTVLKDTQGFQLITNFAVMPMFLLSGALFPLGHLPILLRLLTRLDPLSYGVDGLRGTLIGVWQFSFSLDMAFLGGLAALFLVMGAYMFSQMEK